MADQGLTIECSNQTLIDPANGITGVPSSKHGSYAYVFVVGTVYRDDLGTTAQLNKSPVASPFIVPTPLITAALLKYFSMRRTDTGAVGGYAHWINVTGDTAGAPAAIGTVGTAQIVGIYPI